MKTICCMSNDDLQDAIIITNAMVESSRCKPHFDEAIEHLKELLKAQRSRAIMIKIDES